MLATAGTNNARFQSSVRMMFETRHGAQRPLEFVRALILSVLRSCIQDKNFTLSLPLLKHRGGILRYYVGKDEGLQMEVLYAVEELMNRTRFKSRSK
jgi:hypothetical protein